MDYGPYLKGVVNWVHVHIIINIIQMNLWKIHFWMDMCSPVGLEATRAYSVTGAAHHAPMDWACVEGTWRRFVCWMDYWYVLLVLHSIFSKHMICSDLFGVLFLFSPNIYADSCISTAFNVS